jgi:hypothetical protein
MRKNSNFHDAALSCHNFLPAAKKHPAIGDSTVYACYSSVCPVDNNSVGENGESRWRSVREKVVEKVAKPAKDVAS